MVRNLFNTDVIKISRNSIKKNLHVFGKTRLNGDAAGLAAGLERYAKVISILSTERWKKTTNFTSNCQPFEQRGFPFVTNLLSSLNRTRIS